MEQIQQSSQVASRNNEADQKRYEAPAVIYEGMITTRAGSPVGGGDNNAVDPADLFGN